MSLFRSKIAISRKRALHVALTAGLDLVIEGPQPFHGTPLYVPKSSESNSVLMLLLLDARRYFKQSEIVLYRQAPEVVAAQQLQAQAQPQQITGAAG